MKAKFQSKPVIQWNEIVRLLSRKRSLRELARESGFTVQVLSELRRGNYIDTQTAGGLILLDAFIQENGADHPAIRQLPVFRLNASEESGPDPR